MDDTVEKTCFDACELFTQLTDEEFITKVKPYIKAYYKHEYGEEMIIHEDEKHPEDLYIYVLVNRDESAIYYNFDKSDFSNILRAKIVNDRKNLKSKDILNFLLYEYKQLFSHRMYSDEEPKKQTKKEKIRL